MLEYGEIEQTIYDAIDQVNETRIPNEEIGKSLDTVLAGEGGKLDSLGFVNLAVTLEEMIQRSTGRMVSIMDLVGSVSPGPLTVSALAEAVTRQLDNKVGDA